MSRQGIQVAINRMKKTSYVGLLPIQKKLIKYDEKIEQLDKFINHTWSSMPRKNNNSVDYVEFEKSKSKLFVNYFYDSLKLIEKLRANRDCLIEKNNLNVQDVYNAFKGIQFHGGGNY